MALVVLATAAAIVASQALISAVFSLTRAAVQLGYCPRMKIDFTSASQMGQVYVASINYALMLATMCSSRSLLPTMDAVWKPAASSILRASRLR